AFDRCTSLTSIAIPEGVTKIGEWTFYGCSSLTSISIPEGVTEIGGYAFSACSSLESAKLPVNLERIPREMFSGCTSLTSVEFPENVKVIGENAFKDCDSLTSVLLPETVTEIEHDAFISCDNLSSVYFPESLVTIGNGAFAYCGNIRSIVIPSSVKTIRHDAFSGSGLQSVALGNGIEVLEWGAIPGSASKIIYPEYLDDIEGWKPSDWDHYGKTGVFTYPSDLTIVFDTDGIGYTDEGKTLYYVPASFEGEFSIPEGVTRIAKPAFAKCNGITALNIPKGILEVDEDAFAQLNIPRVNFADWSDWMANVKLGNINSNPYRNGGVAYAGGIEVNNPEFDDNLTEIPDYVLAGIKFSDEVILPYQLRKIGAYAFRNQKEVFAMELPATLEEIGEHAFDGCELLENPLFPTGLQSIGDYAYRACTSITEIDLPEGLTYLGEGAFESATSLEKAALMADITELQPATFRDCTALYKVYLPAGTTAIGNECFNGCRALDEIVLPASVAAIDSRAFAGTALTKVNLPQGLTSLGKSAFENSNISIVSIGGALEEIPYRAFSSNPIRELTLSEGLKNIGAEAFEGASSIGVLELPSTVESIGEYAFGGVYLGEFTVNRGIRELPAGSCGRPNVLNLPASVASIAPQAIDPVDCRLKVLSVKSSNPPTLSEALTFSQEINDNLVLIVNAGRKSVYERNARWKQIPNILENGETEIEVYMTGDYAITEEIRTTSGLMPAVVTGMKVFGPMTQNDLALVARNMPGLVTLDLSGTTGLTEVGDYEFEGSSLKEIILPEGITRIGDNAFSNCAMLTLPSLPESLTEIGYSAFANSPRITFATLPAAVTTIGGEAFRDCHGLRGMTLGESLESMGGSVFAGCSMLERVDMSATHLYAIPDYAFNGCRMLDEVILPESVESIDSYAFAGTDIRDIEFASGVTSFGNRAFSDCRRMVTANLPEGVNQVQEYMFAECPRLVSASFPASVTSLGTMLFSGDNRLATISSASSTAPSAARNVFSGIRNRYISLIIPRDAFRAYLNAAEWGSFTKLKNGLPVIIPQAVEVSAVPEEDYQELLREDYLEEMAEQSAEENVTEPAERVMAKARAVRRAAQRSGTLEGRSFARLFDGAGLVPGTATRIFINIPEGEELAAVKIGDEDVTDLMEGNSLLVPANAAGSLKIVLKGELTGV
ncbi:MAG: leucine-rich repeat domain-containing protein, partial [Muribaculaceae bacterium]|nr:leucine-rich repeat domain-containing protein [Muribaculaceae bacterium]